MESAVQYLVYDEKSFYYAMHSGRKLYTSLISCIFGSNTGTYYVHINIIMDRFECPRILWLLQLPS